MIRIGQMVLYKEYVKDGEKTSPTYPALIFRIWAGEDTLSGFVGLYVFKDNGIERFGKVSRGSGEGQWDYEDAATKG